MSEVKNVPDVNKLPNGLVKDLVTKGMETMDFINEPVVKATMNEDIFREHFIEVLVNGSDDPDDKRIDFWVNYAGDVYSEVDIIDIDGNVLYTTPGLFARATTNDDSKIPFSEIANTYELKKDGLPGEVDKFMNSITDSIIDKLGIDKTDNTIRWNLIYYEMYDLLDKYMKFKNGETTTINGDNEELQVENEEEVLDDLIDYD